MQRFLIVSGFALILAGALFGGMYASVFLADTKISQSDAMKEAFEIAGESPSSASRLGDLFVRKMLYDDRMASTHGHMTLMGITSLVIGNFIATFRLSRKLLMSASILLVFSGFLLPIGVLAESWQVKLGAYSAVAGGTLFTFAILLFFIGYLRGMKSL
ncbi:hypothetical protein [Ferviditalea candida]|uniref:Uncharacterized protein n=1 Tax=Ferviditalea candida TaxID=3108399 RepID=A0ABU5ZM43_9BACL|nr:hypothetical protein [Paenibacillaceae bacterium T2]